MLREGLLMQGSPGTMSLAPLGAGDSPVMGSRVQVLSSFRMPVVLCFLQGGIAMEGGCKCQRASGCWGSCSPLPVWLARAGGVL